MMTLKKTVAGSDGPEEIQMNAEEEAATLAEWDANDSVKHPPDLSAIDQATLNAALAAPGSVVRALGLIVFDMAIGKIPVNPNYTMTQYVNLLKAKMR